MFKRFSLVAAAVLLFTAAPALADWELGSQALGPAFGWRTQAHAAAGNHDALAVWLDARAGNDRNPDLLAVRMGAAGDPLATIRVHEHQVGWSTSPVVASDGESYLVLWADVQQVFSATIDRQNNVIERELGLSFFPRSVIWNGSFYLATSGHQGVLLHRDGCSPAVC